METEEAKVKEDKFDKRRVLRHAVEAYERRDFEEAANTFSQLIDRVEQQDVEWFIKRCDCYQHLNMDAAAMVDANMVVKLHPESYKGYSLLGTLHQIQGHYDEALFCYFDSLEIIWLSDTNVKLPAVAEKCLENIVRSARPVAELPDNIRDQSVLTQLYILGNSLRREVHHTLSIRAMEVALIVHERMKLSKQKDDPEDEDVDEYENLKMKIYFVLGQSQQGIEKYEESIESFKRSLSLALKVGDISYETKTYLNLSTLCMDQDRYAEAAAHYIRLLAVGQDVLSAVGDDEEKFREHWSMEMEASILLNLCIAFKSLRLYDEAIQYAKRYDKVIHFLNTDPPNDSEGLAQGMRGDSVRPKSVPTLSFTDSFFTQHSVDLSGMLQSKFILGDLHELKGDLDTAMNYYLEWMEMSESMTEDGLENTYLLDTASALSCQGNMLMKQGKFRAALDRFRKQTQLAKKTKVPQLIMDTALSRGDALIALNRTEEAKKVYEFAQKLSRSMDDLEPECMCMWKVASVFAAEDRYTHAAYYCEQAVSLSSKCGKKSVQMKLCYELALYYQHSTSEKELRKAAEILYEMIKFQEEHIFTHRSNGGKYFHEEEMMLGKCYNAMQVIFHKLGYPSVAAVFGEAWRRRKILQLRNEMTQIPEIPPLIIAEPDKKEEAKSEGENEEPPILKVMKHEDFLPKKLENDAVLLTFILCAEGFLVQAIQPGLGVTKSYLSSKFEAKPYSTRPKIERLVAKLGKVSTKEKTATHLCNVYNSEPRCLPLDKPTVRVPLPDFPKKDLQKDVADQASGDHGGESGTVESAPKNADGRGEGQTHELKKQLPLLEELYEILIQPVEDIFINLKPGCNIIVVPDQDLRKIPFDSLTNPSTHILLGDRFNVTMASCFSYLKQSLDDLKPNEIPQRPSTTSKPTNVTSSKRTSPRSKHNSRPSSSAKIAQTSERISTASNSLRPRSSKSPRPSSSVKASTLDKEIHAFRRSEMLKSFSNEADVNSLDLCGFSSSISKLVTQTATGTNILTSPRYPPPYKQIAKKQKCSVVGCPSLPSELSFQGRTWTPKSKLPYALKECKKVAEYFDVIPVLGSESSKKTFINEVKSSTVLHLATFADLQKGLVAFSPDDFPTHDVIADEESYLFGPADLTDLKLDKLQLLVLSCGHGWPDSPTGGAKDNISMKPQLLPEMFLAAGACCVITLLWNIPDLVKDLFFFNFYDSLQSGNLVSRAMMNAKNAVKKRYSDPLYWSGFIALGSDVTVDLSGIRRSQLHASLDIAGGEDLNLNPVVQEVVEPEAAMEKLQSHFSQLAGYLPLKPMNRNVVGALIELLEESMDRLTADSNADRPVILLPDLIGEAKGAVGLLGELGFDFQPADVPTPPPHAFDPSPFTPGQEVAAVVFPHWNKDGMLLPAHQALTGLQDICSNDVALQYLTRILPLSQTLLCSMIDLLAVTRHTPEVQLRIQDDGVRSLWRNRYIHRYLAEIGFMQVHDLIMFYKTARNRTLLIASLQVFASLCLHRNQSVLEHLNISSLGQPPQEVVRNEKRSLKTVSPLILPRKEVILLSSWMEDQHPGKEEERGIKNLAQRLMQAKADYQRTLEHAKWWHKNLLKPQAQIKLSQIGMGTGPKPLKRKVKPGATPSCVRISESGSPEPHDREPFFRTFATAMKKRDYANYLVKKRCAELESRHRAKIHEIYREYAING